MAKTQWPLVAPFGYLTPALMEAYWGTDANTGHDHAGTDDDGSCPQIPFSDLSGNLNLATQVTGLLDLSTNSTGAITTSQYQIAGTSQFNITGISGASTPATGTLRFIRNGDNVLLFIPRITGTSVTVGLALTPATTWDTEILALDFGDYPVKAPIICIDNGVPAPAMMDLPRANTDTLTVYRLDSGNLNYLVNQFVSSGTKGLEAHSISYLGA